MEPHREQAFSLSIIPVVGSFRVMKRILVLVALMVVGCGADMVNSPGRSGLAYGPVNEAQRSGVVRYLNQGADFVIQDRRQDAYAQMYKACDGRYRIDAEGPQVRGGYVVPAGGMLVAGTTEYWYIQFSCVQTGPMAAR